MEKSNRGRVALPSQQRCVYSNRCVWGVAKPSTAATDPMRLEYILRIKTVARAKRWNIFSLCRIQKCSLDFSLWFFLSIFVYSWLVHSWSIAEVCDHLLGSKTFQRHCWYSAIEFIHFSSLTTLLQVLKSENSENKIKRKINENNNSSINEQWTEQRKWDKCAQIIAEHQQQPQLKRIAVTNRK